MHTVSGLDSRHLYEKSFLSLVNCNLGPGLRSPFFAHVRKAKVCGFVMQWKKDPCELVARQATVPVRMPSILSDTVHAIEHAIFVYT
jgi:hypothetical protein